MRNFRSAIDFGGHFAVSRETLDRLQVFADTLCRWQVAINLVAPSTLDGVWGRHFADSAQLLTAVPPNKDCVWLDLGSGAGFPGLVIAILMAERGGGRVILVESDTKKCAFLREIVRATGISGSVAVDIITGRIENSATWDKVGVVDVVSARALAGLDSLLALSSKFFGPDTVGVFPKGREAASEVTSARENWSFSVSVVPSLTDDQASVLVVREPKRLF